MRRTPGPAPAPREAFLRAALAVTVALATPVAAAPPPVPAHVAKPAHPAAPAAHGSTHAHGTKGASGGPVAPLPPWPPRDSLAEAEAARLTAGAFASYDSAHGGFVKRDGTPIEAAIELALAQGRAGDALAFARALRAMHGLRALRDSVGGGFVESPADLDARSTKFDKPTSIHARRMELLALVREISPAADVADWEADRRWVDDYFDRVLIDPRGGVFVGQVGDRELEPEANGLALQAWWRWGVLQQDAKRRAFAWATLDRVWSQCRDLELGMVRRDVWGKIHDPSLLADQSEFGRGCLFAYLAAGRDSDLVRARMLGDLIVQHFEIREKVKVTGGFRPEYMSERYGHARRLRRPFDDNARAARFLAELTVVTRDTSYAGAARRAIVAFAPQLQKPALANAEWALAAAAFTRETGVMRGTWGEGPKAKPAPGGAKPGRKPGRRR